MLVLMTTEGGRIRLTVHGLTIWVMLPEIVSMRKARIAIDAPPEVEIKREELLPQGERYHAAKRAAGPGAGVSAPAAVAPSPPPCGGTP